jgi:hypothetical protein
LSNVELVRSGVLAAESNTINEKRTKTLAKSIVEISFIKALPKGTKGWVFATTVSRRKLGASPKRASDMPD